MIAKKPANNVWCVYLISRKRQYLGTVEARDLDAAIKKAIEEFGINDRQRQRRLVARPLLK